MPTPETKPKRTADWSTLQRSRRARPVEWLVERGVFLVSLSAIVMTFLIFLFVAREALPVALGKMTSSKVGKVIPVADLDKTSKAELMDYLDLTPKQFAGMDKDTLNPLKWMWLLIT